MVLNKKVIALNFKTYAQSTGAAGAKLLEACELVASKHPNAEVIAAPQIQDISLSAILLKAASLFSQHSDSVKQGAFTGWIAPAGLKAAGCAGTILNHSEHRLDEQKVGETVAACKAAGVRSIVCAENVKEALLLAKLEPWAVAYEPPELIGSGVSVSSAKPEIVSEFVARLHAERPWVLPIVGAGVSNENDVAKCVELGAKGVLLASAFIKAPNPAELLEKMAGALGH